jgi:hypothetical protein
MRGVRDTGIFSYSTGANINTLQMSLIVAISFPLPRRRPNRAHHPFPYSPFSIVPYNSTTECGVQTLSQSSPDMSLLLGARMNFAAAVLSSIQSGAYICTFGIAITSISTIQVFTLDDYIHNCPTNPSSKNQIFRTMLHLSIHLLFADKQRCRIYHQHGHPGRLHHSASRRQPTRL